MQWPTLSSSPSPSLSRVRALLTIAIILNATITIPNAQAAGQGSTDDLQRMFDTMESETKSWARHMESLILPINKCLKSTLRSCEANNYNGCVSEYPYATCPGAENRILACGRGEEGGCGGLFDFTTSRVTVAKEEKDVDFGNAYGAKEIEDPTNRVKDGICASRPSDEWVVKAREESNGYWQQFKVASPGYYYGNDDGVFRMLPGAPEQCASSPSSKVLTGSSYDPRIRPWYVAASSGPKDIILILDTSGSMGNYGRLDTMKEAAKRVVDTLGVSDYVSVIGFNDDAYHLGRGIRRDDNDGTVQDGILHRAREETKERIMKDIDRLEARLGTNFASGFDLAFKTFRDSNRMEKTSGCHKAILFLTDGAMQDDRSTLFNKIDAELAAFNGNNGNDPPVFFTYSFGDTADIDVPKTIACKYGGIWASIGDYDGANLSKSMGAYYKYFAYGLSGEKNENFVAWVQPYIYANTGELGTTASAPVYDRSVSPPILAGVVGMDFSFAAMERALGDEGEKGKDAILKRIVERSTASCPNLDLTACQLQSLREFGSGDESDAQALCSSQYVTDDDGNEVSCTTQPLKPTLCDSYVDPGDRFANRYPDDVWNNELNKYRSFEEKTCCSVGDEPRIANADRTEEMLNELVCKEKASNLGLIISLVAAGVVSVALATCCYLFRKRKKGSNNSNGIGNGNGNGNGHLTASHVVSSTVVAPGTEFGQETYDPNHESVVAVPVSFEPEIVVLPPPSAPDYR